MFDPDMTPKLCFPHWSHCTCFSTYSWSFQGPSIQKNITNQNPILSKKNPRLLEKNTARWGWFSNVALGGIIIQVWFVEAVISGSSLLLVSAKWQCPETWGNGFASTWKMIEIMFVQKYSASKILGSFFWFGGWKWWDFMIFPQSLTLILCTSKKRSSFLHSQDSGVQIKQMDFQFPCFPA